MAIPPLLIAVPRRKFFKVHLSKSIEGREKGGGTHEKGHSKGIQGKNEEELEKVCWIGCKTCHPICSIGV